MSNGSRSDVAYTAGMKIAELEQNKNWQATAEDKNGHQVAIMRGHPNGEFEGKYYLYDGNWTATAYPSGAQGMPDYSVEAIKSLFDAGKLKLLKGSPTSLVSPNVTQIGLDD
jgi:hypothetical protein